MTTYTGIAIGPIFSTIDTARKTRELWASSYLFSYCIRRLTEAFKAQSAHFEVLLPHLDDTHPQIGTGLYPDRIYLRHKSEEATTLLGKIAQNVFKELSKDIANRLADYPQVQPPNSEEVAAYLYSFFLLKAQTLKLEEATNIIETISPYLESIEETPKLPAIDQHAKILGRFFDTVSLWKNKAKEPSFLFKDAFGHQQKRFDSLIEIAARDLQGPGSPFEQIIAAHFEALNEGNTQEEDELFQQLYDVFNKGKPLEEQSFLHYHRHIAIVHADGDNVGAILQKMGTTPAGVQDFSKFLHQFAIVATDIIRNYQAVPIYVGGDDLFFLAPVARAAQEGQHTSILHLAKALDQAFQNAFLAFQQRQQPLLADIKKIPTLSFGINIEHFKSPLYEGIQHARNLLFKRAKNKKLHPNKHMVCLRLSTHSGLAQTLDCSLDNAPVFDACTQFIQTYTARNIRFFNSFARRLYALDVFFVEAIKTRGIDITRFIEELIKHQAEDINQERFKNDVVHLLHLLYHPDHGVEDAKTLLEFTIRFVHFLNRKIDV